MMTPDLVIYYSKSDSDVYETLASSKNWVEKINNIPIYSDALLTNSIGYITTTFTENKEITLFSSYVIFSVINGAINYAHTQFTSDNNNSYYVDTITYGNGDFTFSKGYVITYIPENLNVIKAEFYLTK
jgi:hypothetical protein